MRDEVAASSPRHGDALIEFLKTALDQVRRDWIAGDRRGWLGLNVPYCGLDEVRRLVAEPERAVVVTTKEGEFTRLILDDWQVRMADVQGKEAGSHKCDNLRALIAAYQTAHGRRPRLTFVEDRLETLRARHHASRPRGREPLPRRVGVQHARDAGSPSKRPVRLLELDQFRKGLEAWP